MKQQREGMRGDKGRGKGEKELVGYAQLPTRINIYIPELQKEAKRMYE